MKFPKRNKEVSRHSVTVRHISEHNGGEIPNHHAWYLPGTIIYRDAVGGLNDAGGNDFSWMLLACENPGCGGTAIVLLDDFTNRIPLGTVLPDPPGTQEKYDEEMRKQRGEQ